ncbi:MAG: glycosyltransferase, partial [Sphingopyxis sp.]
DRIHTLPLPIVCAAMEEIGRARSAADWGNPPRLLSLGRLVPQKDHAMLLDAMALLADQPWHLTIAGDGPLMAPLLAQTARLGLCNRVTFTGFVDQPAHSLAQADALLLSSRWEGLGAVAIEALACGVAVVATDCTPNLHSLLHNAGQHQPTPIGDAVAFARAIAATLDRPPICGPMRAAALPYGIDAAIDAHVAMLAPWLGGDGAD